jgi:hypothetical protein
VDHGVAAVTARAPAPIADPPEALVDRVLAGAPGAWARGPARRRRRRPALLRDCHPAFEPDPPGVTIRRAQLSSALPGLVADAVEDFSHPSPDSPLLHFVHHTLSAP